jgi:hypothetical protein
MANDMNFIRKKIRGQNQKVRRIWLSSNYYRIIWRVAVYGVRVPARFQATVRVLVPYSDGTVREAWDFVNRHRRLIKTLRAAIEECERHHRLWTQACEATSIRDLKEMFGKLPVGLPVWVRKKLDRRLYGILIDNRPGKYRNDDDEDESRTESIAPPSDAPGPGGPMKTSESSASLASHTEGKAESPTRRTRRVGSRKSSTPHLSASAKPRAHGSRISGS